MLDTEVKDFVHKHIAREIEFSAALAREFGFAFPKEYALGFNSEMGPVDEDRKKWWLVTKIRVDDFSHEFKVKLPSFDYEDSDLNGDLARLSCEFVSRYIDANPKIRPKGVRATEIAAMLEKRDGQDALIAAAEKSAASATYRAG